MSAVTQATLLRVRLRRWVVFIACGVFAAAALAGCGGSASKTRRQPAHSAPGRVASASPAAAPSAARPRIPLAALHGRLVYGDGNDAGDDIWIARADGSRAHRITHRKGAEFDPTWSPDGRLIAYRDSRRGINNNDEIYVVSSDGSHPRNLTRSPANEWSPSWSPDGKLIAYYAGELWVMRPDGRGKHRVSRVEGEYPAWSPDSRRIAFMSAQPDARGNDPNYDVMVIGRDGRGLRQLTDWPGEDGWPAWSPDGREIAFCSSHHRPDGIDRRLYVMNADGRHKRLLVSHMAGAFPVWSPDGKEILFTGDGNQLWVVRPDGSGLRRIRARGWLADWHR